jgi:hypothetical protein
MVVKTPSGELRHVFHPDTNPENYVPYIRVGRLTSLAKATLWNSRKIKRTLHLLSQGELARAIMLERQPDVIGIFEQFWLDPDVTVSLAKRFGIRHPKIFKENGKYLKPPKIAEMTSDLVVWRVNEQGFVHTEVYSCKPDIYKLSKRDVDKLKLEKAYWESYGADWFLVSDKDYAKAQISSCKFLYHFVDFSISARELTEFTSTFKEAWAKDPFMWLGDILDALSPSHPLPLALFATAFYQNYLLLDLDMPVHLDYAVNLLDSEWV